MWQCYFSLEIVTYIGSACNDFEVRWGIKFSVLLFLEYVRGKNQFHLQMTRGHIAYLSDKATAGNFSYPYWRDEKAAANNIVRSDVKYVKCRNTSELFDVSWYTEKPANICVPLWRNCFVLCSVLIDTVCSWWFLRADSISCIHYILYVIRYGVWQCSCLRREVISFPQHRQSLCTLSSTCSYKLYLLKNLQTNQPCNSTT